MRITTVSLLAKAADLLSQPADSNVHVGTYNDAEYDRAVVELTTALIGLSEEDYDAVYRILRVIKAP